MTLGEDASISGPEILLLVEALDALIPFTEETAYTATPEERRQWAAHNGLRSRLKRAIRMSFYENANHWLESELRRERIALTDALHTRLAALLRDPRANRRSVRNGFVAAILELRDKRQSPPRPLS